MWPGNGDGESAKFWYAVLTELKNHGVKGGCSSWSATGSRTCPTRSGRPFPATRVQMCLIHLLRNNFRYAPKKH